MKFRYYAGHEDGSGLRDEFEHASAQFRARFRSKLLILAQLELVDWREPLFKVLSDEDGISEMRFKADNIQQRSLGFLSGNNEYTFLLWAQEKNNRFIPKAACEIAKKRRTACITDRSLTRVLWIPLE